MCFEYDEYDRIEEKKIAKEIWEVLQTHHEGTNHVTKTRIDMRVKKFDMFEMNESENIDEIFPRFIDLTNELRYLGKI